MADGVTTQSSTLATVPASTVIATDDAGASGHVQVVKLAISTDGSATVISADATNGLDVDVTRIQRSIVRIQVTPTISTTAYALKDAVGGLMTFANAASVSGGSCAVRSVVVVDKDADKANLDLVLFRASITAPTDNAAFDPTDTELLDHVGTIPILGGDYAEFNDNAAATVQIPDGLFITLDGTSLFGVLVARDTPTYVSTSDIVVTLFVERFG